MKSKGAPDAWVGRNVGQERWEARGCILVCGGLEIMKGLAGEDGGGGEMMMKSNIRAAFVV